LRGIAANSLQIQVAVVDNSATRKLAPVAAAYGARYIKTARNLGFGAGHNLVLRHMLGRARYHLVINPDITLHAGVIDRMFGFMQQHPEVGQGMPQVLNPDGTQQMLCKLLPSPVDLLARRFLGHSAGLRISRRDAHYELQHVDLSRAAYVPCLSGCFMFLRDAALQCSGLFDERYFLYMEDVDLCRRIGTCAATVFYPSVSITHRYAKGSYRNWRLLRYHIASAWSYFNKWGWWHDPERRKMNKRIGPFMSSETEVYDLSHADIGKP
jgi:hypothetical protein